MDNEKINIRCRYNPLSNSVSVIACIMALLLGLLLLEITGIGNAKSLTQTVVSLAIAFSVALIFSKYVFVYNITIARKGLGFIVSCLSSKNISYNPRYEKYIVYYTSFPKSKPVLILELWFDKHLIVFMEILAKDIPSNLPVYLKTNINHNYQVIEKGSIDKITDFLDSYPEVRLDDNI